MLELSTVDLEEIATGLQDQNIADFAEVSLISAFAAAWPGRSRARARSASP